MKKGARIESRAKLSLYIYREIHLHISYFFKNQKVFSYFLRKHFLKISEQDTFLWGFLICFFVTCDLVSEMVTKLFQIYVIKWASLTWLGHINQIVFQVFDLKQMYEIPKFSCGHITLKYFWIFLIMLSQKHNLIQHSNDGCNWRDISEEKHRRDVQCFHFFCVLLPRPCRSAARLPGQPQMTGSPPGPQFPHLLPPQGRRSCFPGNQLKTDEK